MTTRPITHYDTASRALHWITAVIVVIAFILGPAGYGRLIHQGVDPATHSDIVWHESLGVLVTLLTLLRLVWLALRPPPPRFAMPGWMQAVARLMHLVLWALLLAMPTTAMLALGSEDHPLTLLGGVRVDHLTFITGSALAKLADWGDVHKFLGDTIVWLSGLHALAAIYHQWVLKDGVLRSMLPPRASR